MISEKHRVLGRLLLPDEAWVEVRENQENRGQRREENKMGVGGNTRHQRQ